MQNASVAERSKALDLRSTAHLVRARSNRVGGIYLFS